MKTTCLKCGYEDPTGSTEEHGCPPAQWERWYLEEEYARMQTYYELELAKPEARAGRVVRRWMIWWRYWLSRGREKLVYRFGARGRAYRKMKKDEALKYAGYFEPEFLETLEKDDAD